MKKRIINIIFLIIIVSIISFSSGIPLKQNLPVSNDKGWEKQLNEMNHLVILISSVNIINGLYFSKEQAALLNKYSIEFTSSGLPELDTTGNTSKDLVDVRRVYFQLLNLLLKKESVSDSLRKQVYAARIKESEIIKKSIAGAQKRGNKDIGCLQCHCIPEYFPKGDISEKVTKSISPEERAGIDKAHTIGLFGYDGMIKLWFMMNKTDSVLTDGQQYIMKNFKCCLVPPADLKDPTNIGQAFVSNEWINYFRAIRKLDEKQWELYKDLFILPLDTLLKATLPGISSKKSKEILHDAETVIKDARSLDAIDFELQKEAICLKMKDAIKPATPSAESFQEADIRKFVTAMFLLFPGSDVLYANISKLQEKQ
ncbi:MAG: hypothetical protein V1904_09720 [Bacteroidota bacterium]